MNWPGSSSIFENPANVGTGYALQLVYTLKSKAMVLKALYDESGNIEYLRHAFETLIRAETLLNIHRNSFYWEESKIKYRQRMRSLTDVALAYGLQLFRATSDDAIIERCFSIMENAKYSLLFEDLRDSRTSRITRETEIKKLIADLQLKMHTSESDRPMHTTLRQKLDSAESRLQEYYDSIASFSPLIGNVNSYSGTEFQSNVEYSSSLLVSYYWGDTATYVISINPAGRHFYTIRKRAQLEQEIAEFKKMVSHFPELSTVEGVEKYIESSRFIYNTLLPAEAEKYAEVVVIPDGAIVNLPVEALLYKDPEQNCKSYECLPYFLYASNTIYLVSYSVAQFMSNNVDNFEGQMLAVAPAQTGNILLPGALKEVESLSRFGAHLMLTSFGSKADFLSKLGGYDIIHIATHAQANPSDGLNSFLNLSDDEKDRVYAYEILGMKLDADLVMLTACETGEGEVKEGEGLFGLGRSFIAAGAHSLILSSWKIPDDITRQIVDRFYDQFAVTNSASQALRISKIDYLKSQDGFTSHPFFWSALHYLGNTKEFNSKSSSGKTVMTLNSVCVLMGMIIFFVLKKKREFSPL